MHITTRSARPVNEWAATSPAVSASSLSERQTKVKVGPASCDGRGGGSPSWLTRHFSRTAGKWLRKPGRVSALSPRMATVSGESSGVSRRAISRSTARPSRPNR